MKKISKLFNKLFASNSTVQPQKTKLLAIEGEFVRPGQVPAEILRDLANLRIVIFLKDKNLATVWQAVFAKQQPEIHIIDNQDLKISTILTHHVIWETACHKYTHVSILSGIFTLKSLSLFLKNHHIETSFHYITEENKVNRLNKNRATPDKKPLRKDAEVSDNKEVKVEKKYIDESKVEVKDLSKEVAKPPQRKPKTAENTPQNTELPVEKDTTQPVVKAVIELDKLLIIKFLEHLSKQIELNLPIRKGYIGTLVNQATGKPSVEVFPGGINTLVLFLTQQGHLNEIDRQTCSFSSFPEISVFEKYPIPNRGNEPDPSSSHSRNSRNRRRNPSNRRKTE